MINPKCLDCMKSEKVSIPKVITECGHVSKWTNRVLFCHDKGKKCSEIKSCKYFSKGKICLY